jgi:hypothetical protein
MFGLLQRSDITRTAICTEARKSGNGPESRPRSFRFAAVPYRHPQATDIQGELLCAERAESCAARRVLNSSAKVARKFIEERASVPDGIQLKHSRCAKETGSLDRCHALPRYNRGGHAGVPKGPSPKHAGQRRETPTEPRKLGLQNHAPWA